MNGRLRGCDTYRRLSLSDGWEVAAVGGSQARWFPAMVPGTVAASLRLAGEWDVDSTPRQFDAEEWCYRLRFNADPAAPGERIILGFEGLATLAQVRLNGSMLFDSNNMFIGHRCDVTDALRRENELLICFAPLDAALNARRGRPRWRTPMVKHQQLRWMRTCLLGRTPGWSPPAAPVGPWRPVWLERRRLLELGEHRLDARLDGADGQVNFSCALSALAESKVRSARLVAQRNGRRFEVRLSVGPSGVRGELNISHVDLWWPHTHGEPALYQISLLIELEERGARTTLTVDLGNVGFRSLRLDREAGRFTLYVNDREVFCRGAAWMPIDCISLQARQGDYHKAIGQAREAGMNMLRLAGPTVYETDDFFDCCDSAGVMVWQDFMFANMDYPGENADFAASVQLEAHQQLSRLQARPSLAVLCGNSEGAQQAAMSGAAREHWAPRLFEVDLAAWSSELCPGVPYCASSTHGGAFPFQPAEGVCSYYGVGAYLKPLSDARRSGVRFASECLAFANIPEAQTLALLTPGQPIRAHHARWKERSPRDQGAGWDFDDVRDFYLEQLFGVNALQVRYADHDRYLRLGRIASGEVMAATFSEWRRSGSSCKGALVWFLKDLWPGAGWGVIDSTGLPKAAFYYMKRVLQPVAVFVTDEDCNGLMLHVVNETGSELKVNLQLKLFRSSLPVGLPVAKTLTLNAASAMQIPATDLFEGFMDLSYAFRFGPAAYEVLQATLLSADDEQPLAEGFHFAQGLARVGGVDAGLSASALRFGEGWRVTIRAKNFAQSVHLDAAGFVADDQYFHLIPNSSRTVTLTPRTPGEMSALDGAVYALNAASPCAIELAS